MPQAEKQRSASLGSQTIGSPMTLKLVFKKAGTFQVVCDVPRHIQLGMVSSFKVK